MKRLCRSVWCTGLAFVLGNFMSTAAQAQTIGDAMITYLDSQLNTRVGGGGSSHMASEALRVSGGEFYPGDLGADYPGVGDRVWGTVVTVIRFVDGSVTDSNPDNPCQPGDILQFGGPASFGDVTYPSNFTAVIRKCDGTNRSVTVYQQNFNRVRVVQSASVNLNQLTDGWVRIYRPKARVDVLGTWKFTVVNNASTSQTFTIMYDITTVARLTATASNTYGSYSIHKVTTDGAVPCVVNNDNTIYVETAKANEIYTAVDGGFAFRQLAQ